MNNLQDYASSSDSETENSDKFAHLKPIDEKSSVAKTLSVVAAPDVVPIVSIFRRNVIVYFRFLTSIFITFESGRK